MSARVFRAFDHLERLSDARGLFEHAKGADRREEQGYCTDDNARLLVVASREADLPLADRLGRLALAFIVESQAPDGSCRNRMDRDGRWTDQPSTEDCWGRSVWGLGAAAAGHTDPLVRAASLDAFDRGIAQRSRWSRAMAFAALGAADVVATHPEHQAARDLLIDALDVIVGEGRGGSGVPRPMTPDWNWPEARLRYANAALAEAVIAAGAALDRPADLAQGLAMLAWLLDLQTSHGHLSLVGVEGRGPKNQGPQFDQQPIEAAAMAEACWRAHAATGDSSWLAGVDAAARWFEGDNDTGAAMYDRVGGGGYDGLERHGVNINQGAESTLALASTMQRSLQMAETR
ncbi:MAG: glycosyltransferase [Actinomycetota bacterium]|nr:glycosyltransferase [Actinomycetota bacterium]